VVLALFGFPIALQAVIHLAQELGDFLMADRMILLRQFGRQRAGALAGPAQGRFRVVFQIC
jgi:hypothetical protein